MYSTPELLLVGAAQHLVLGDSPLEVGSVACLSTADIREEPDETYIDFPGW
jgi:hypothetical protein